MTSISLLQGWGTSSVGVKCGPLGLSVHPFGLFPGQPPSQAIPSLGVFAWLECALEPWWGFLSRLPGWGNREELVNVGKTSLLFKAKNHIHCLLLVPDPPTISGKVPQKGMSLLAYPSPAVLIKWSEKSRVRNVPSYYECCYSRFSCTRTNVFIMWHELLKRKACSCFSILGLWNSVGRNQAGHSSQRNVHCGRCTEELPALMIQFINTKLHVGSGKAGAWKNICNGSVHHALLTVCFILAVQLFHLLCGWRLIKGADK